MPGSREANVCRRGYHISYVVFLSLVGDMGWYIRSVHKTAREHDSEQRTATTAASAVARVNCIETTNHIALSS